MSTYSIGSLYKLIILHQSEPLVCYFITKKRGQQTI